MNNYEKCDNSEQINKLNDYSGKTSPKLMKSFAFNNDSAFKKSGYNSLNKSKITQSTTCAKNIT